MSTPTFSDLTDALSAPVGDLIASIGRSMAEAQQEMDAATIANFKSVYDEGNEAFEALRKLGYQPTWYQIPEVSAEINMALTVSGSNETSGKKTNAGSPLLMRTGIKLYANPVDATFTNKYGFEYKSSSKISFRIVPIPPSAAAEGIKIVPNLLGTTFAEAESKLRALSIAYELNPDAPASPKSSAKVKGQSVAPGEIIRADEALILSL